MGEEKAGPVVAVGTPGPPEPDLLESLLALRTPESGWVYLKAWDGKAEKLAVDVARNRLVEAFLNGHEERGLARPLEWLLQVDRDAVLHPGTLERLLSWGKPCVGALAVTRYVPPIPIVFGEQTRQTSPTTRHYKVRIEDTLRWLEKYPQLATKEGPALLEPRPEEALWEATWTGGHCFLVHRSVYEALEPPWFSIDPETRHGTGVDRLFFERVREAGFPVYVDMSVVAGHLGKRVMGMLDLLAWMGRIVVQQDQAMEKEPGPGGGAYWPDRERPAEWYDRVFEQHPELARAWEDHPKRALWEWAARDLEVNGIRRVVDLGCGAGQFAGMLRDSGSVDSYIGIDFSGARIRHAAALYLWDDRFVFQQADVEEWLRRGSGYGLDVEAVTAIEFLEHVKNDREILAMVPAGALVVLTVAGFEHESHVRAFRSRHEAAERYGDLVVLEAWQEFDVGGLRYFGLVGRRRSDEGAVFRGDDGAERERKPGAYSVSTPSFVRDP